MDNNIIFPMSIEFREKINFAFSNPCENVNPYLVNKAGVCLQKSSFTAKGTMLNYL